MISIEEINKLINNLWGDSDRIGKTIEDIEYVQKLKTVKLYLENNPSEKSLRRQLSEVGMKIQIEKDKDEDRDEVEIMRLKSQQKVLSFILHQ